MLGKETPTACVGLRFRGGGGLGSKVGVILTHDIGEQQGQGDGDGGGAERCAFPVAAPVRLAEGEERPRESGPGQGARGRRVHSVGRERVVLTGGAVEGGRGRAMLEEEVPERGRRMFVTFQPRNDFCSVK